MNWVGELDCCCFYTFLLLLLASQSVAISVSEFWKSCCLLLAVRLNGLDVIRGQGGDSVRPIGSDQVWGWPIGSDQAGGWVLVWSAATICWLNVSPGRSRPSFLLARRLFGFKANFMLPCFCRPTICVRVRRKLMIEQIIINSSLLSKSDWFCLMPYIFPSCIWPSFRSTIIGPRKILSLTQKLHMLQLCV